MAKAKLESEGIRCFIANENINIANPFVWSEVTLQVAELDVHRAREILDRPAQDDAEGEYVEEEFRCPKCHRSEIDLLPLSMRWRVLRWLWIVLLILPVLSTFLEMTGVNLPARLHVGGDLLLIWMLVVVVLGARILLLKRRKRCRACGLEWVGERAQS